MRITVLVPGRTPVEHEVRSDSVLVGRSRECDLVVDDALLSRVHAEIRRDGARGWVVVDRGSRNGTRVNGRAIEDAAPIGAGDRIQIGGAVLAIDLPTADPARAEATTTAASAGEPAGEEDVFVGRSPGVVALLAAVRRLASEDVTVLVQGESGTGKELIARLLHAGGRRAIGPFVAVNCPAIPAGLLEAEIFGIERGTATGVEARRGRADLASGGTLFLDEVADLDLASQAKLLRFLQERTIEPVGARVPRRVDVRVVAATNQDLAHAVAAGRFRHDLLHRLAAVTLRIPPLRERREDVPLLAEHVLRRRRGPHELSEDALLALESHDWPGNVRELEHALERARLFATGRTITAADLALGAAPDAAGADAVGRLLDALDGGGSFWTLVRDPFLRRELSRDTVRELVARAHAQSGGSYLDLARRWRMEGEHKRLLDFLRRHGLGVARR